MENKLYQIEEVAEKTSLTKRALRYYEDMELIVPRRTDSGYRLYTEEDIDRIIRIRELKESMGFCLIDIKSLLELEKDLKEILDGKPHERSLYEKCIAEVAKKIEMIESKEKTLQRVKCKYIETLERLTSLKTDGENR